ncbi:MAG: beta-galactosidase, partial [Alistipes sp.]|nr:beta-galactosidase [Alistipes sp.]
YLKKVDGKWWFVDPEGCLWWSHGVVRVTPSCAVTPIDNRKFYYEALPEQGSEYEKFYYTHDALLKPYYTQRGHKETYDFSSANIYRKYGENYLEKYGEMAHRRLRSWGLNTIANSSDKDICLMSKTPYIERLEIHSAPIDGTGGLWWQISDPFDKSFKEELIAQLSARKKELNDPYLVGLFVDNELKWGGESYLAEKAAKNPATAAVKRELVKHYKAKYGKIAKLNAVWGTSFASWNALLANTKDLPKQASADLVEFNNLIIHGYFRNIREVFNEYAPGVLYLGCRYAGRSSNPNALRIGSQYSDAISHNMYNFTLSDYRQPEGIDKPMIIGEFHFGTMNQGLFHHSLIRVENQKERGEAYAAYVRSALEHPQIVGTHWHQFSDQSATGRFDGENLQVGFTDICDTPYYGTIDGIREVGYDMYSIRANAK